MQNYCWHLRYGHGLGLQSWDSYAIVDVKDVSTKVGVILYRQDFGFSPRRWVSWVLGKIPGQNSHDESREGVNYQRLWERSRVVLDVRNSLGQWHLLLIVQLVVNTLAVRGLVLFQLAVIQHVRIASQDLPVVNLHVEHWVSAPGDRLAPLVSLDLLLQALVQAPHQVGRHLVQVELQRINPTQLPG